MREDARILLVHAINPAMEVETRYPSLGLAYLVSAARKALPHAKLSFRIADRAIPAVVHEFKPDLVGISSVSQNYNQAIAYADFCASQGIPVVMGGIHLSFLPQTLPASAMAACVGEGESSFVRIVRALLDGVLPSGLSSIPGLAVRENGRIRETGQAAVEANLDSLPMPARELLPLRKHAHMFTSRGCPYRCTFCASSRFWDNVRFFSAQYVADEIRTLVNTFGARRITFSDDLFVARRPRVEELIGLLEKSRLLGTVRFTCACRANLVDRELAGLLARLGVVSVGVGLESGDDQTLAYLKGGSVSVEQNRQAVSVLRSAGIAVNGSFVIGSPQESREQILRTYHFIRTSALSLFEVYVLTPFPGTPVWEYAKQKGLVSDDMQDWSRLNVNAYSMKKDRIVVLSEVLSRKEVLSLYRAFRRLRYRRALSRVLQHPMLLDVPSVAWRLLKEKTLHLFSRGSSGVKL